MNPEVLKQGAEAKVYLIQFGGRQAIAKQRFKKTYRHPILDSKLTSRRIAQEARSLDKMGRLEGIRVPSLYLVDFINSTIYMEYIDSSTVRDLLADSNDFEDIGRQIGSSLSKIHNSDTIHGDLTTSNMLSHQGSIAWIDFGLSYVSTMPEDKAVDLYVLERAILSTHPAIGTKLFQIILESYAIDLNFSKEILKRFEEVRLRGRKRVAFG